MSFAASRARVLARYGRNVVLTRPNDSPAPAPLTVLAYLSRVAQDGVSPPASQDIGLVNIGPLSWSMQPGQGTWVQIDGEDWAVERATPVYAGPDLIGWTLAVRGGQP